VKMVGGSCGEDLLNWASKGPCGDLSMRNSTTTLRVAPRRLLLHDLLQRRVARSNHGADLEARLSGHRGRLPPCLRHLHFRYLLRQSNRQWHARISTRRE
jgi:hypothetical protein